MATSLKPYNPSPGDIASFWHVVDARGQTLGRMATDIAVKLMGKHRATYVPHLLSGDFVVVVNAAKVQISGKKAQQKLYRRHSGYPGNLKEIPYARVMERTPERIIEQAVKGMLPKNRLGRKALRRLKVYAGPEHPHEAQVIGSGRAQSQLAPAPNLDDIDLTPAPPAAIEQATPTTAKPLAPEATEPVAEASAQQEPETESEIPEPAPEVADETADVADEDTAPTMLSDLGVNPRVLAALEAEGLDTLADVTTRSDEQLLGVKGFGAKSLQDLDDALAEAGLSRG